MACAFRSAAAVGDVVVIYLGDEMTSWMQGVVLEVVGDQLRVGLGECVEHGQQMEVPSEIWVPRSSAEVVNV